MNSYSSVANNTDLPIMATADDAITAKQAAVDTGYYDDPFLQSFVVGSNSNNNKNNSNPISRRPHHQRQGRQQQQPIRRVQPIIKRGTHARVCVMDKALSGFLKLHSHGSKSKSGISGSSGNSGCQVVVLGAGKDTSYFRYCTNSIMGLQNEEDQEQEQQQQQSETTTLLFQNEKVDWYEVDHSVVIDEKASIIQSSTLLSEQLCGGGSLIKTQHGYQYHSSSSSASLTLIGHDLRSNPIELLQKLNLNNSKPTIILLECVLMYMPSMDTTKLLQAFSDSNIENLYVVAYEPILGGLGAPQHAGSDKFGHMMEKNICQRIKNLSNQSSLLVDRTLDCQLSKFCHKAKFDTVIGCDMWSAYETIVTSKQRTRANQSEFLDEIEEWILIMQHYCFIVAQKRQLGSNDGYNNKEQQQQLTSIGPSSPIGFISGKCQIKTRKERINNTNT